MSRKTIVIVAAFLVIVAAVNMAYVQSLPTTKEMKVQAFDFFFTVPAVQGNNPTITVRTGDTIILTLQNMGTKDDHEFFVLTQSDFNNYIKVLANGQNATEPLPAFADGSVEDVPPGQSKTGTFVVGAPGTYVYACLDKETTDPLTHANDGMFGTFIVENGGISSVVRSFSATFGSMFTNALSNVPSIALWQAAIVLSLAAITAKRTT